VNLIKKSDVKIHFSSHRNRGLHLFQQLDKPASAAFPVADSAIESNEAVFVEDFSLEHSYPGRTVSVVVAVAGSDDTQNPGMRSTLRL
jgi:hypothetical protein